MTKHFPRCWTTLEISNNSGAHCCVNFPIFIIASSNYCLKDCFYIKLKLKETKYRLYDGHFYSDEPNLTIIRIVAQDVPDFHRLCNCGLLIDSSSVSSFWIHWVFKRFNIQVRTVLHIKREERFFVYPEDQLPWHFLRILFTFNANL